MYLLDTDTVIYALKGHPGVTERLRARMMEPKAISVVSYGELCYGAIKSSHREENLAKIRRLGELFPVMEVSRATMETFASLKYALERQGNRLADFDLIIAATALTLNYCLVTNNEKHFRHIPGLKLENWIKADRKG